MQIHWIGGNMPQIGKAWAVRALTESLFERDNKAPLVVDTSPKSPLSQIYNPLLLKTHQPAHYFNDNGLAADEILSLAEFYRIIVVKLASYTQDTFLSWLKNSGILDIEIEQHFWFVTNGHRDSFIYFTEICRYDAWQIHWVRNHYGRTWLDADRQTPNLINVCDLPGIISNPYEIDYIEVNRIILKHLVAQKNNGLSSLTRRRVKMFLDRSHQSFLKCSTDENKDVTNAIPPPATPESVVSEAYDLALDLDLIK